MIKRLHDIYYGQVDVFYGLTRTSEFLPSTYEVEILVEHVEPNENIWGNANELLTVFRTVKEGWFGYYHLTPAGYSSYTYDPDEKIIVYKTTSLDWFVRYALTEHLRNTDGVRRLIMDEEIHSFLSDRKGKLNEE
jgi:hypothetical protein